MLKNRHYTKKPLDHQSLILQLLERGLLIDDPKRAEIYLGDIGYYRLIGYGLPFEKFSDGSRLDCYVDGTTFDHILNAYIVDRKIRVLLLSAIERIEVAIRNTISHLMCCKYDSAHWFMDPSLFNTSRGFTHAKFLTEIHRNTVKTAESGSDKEKLREIFIQHYYSHYDTPEYPPSWMVAEILSLGSWSKVYEHLSVSKDRKMISKKFKLAPATLQSWMHSLTFLRNICAHHGRLFARTLPLSPIKDKQLPLRRENQLFNFVCVIWYMLRTISPNSSWLDKLNEELNGLITDLACYGFSKNWLNDKFWQKI